MIYLLKKHLFKGVHVIRLKPNVFVFHIYIYITLYFYIDLYNF